MEKTSEFLIYLMACSLQGTKPEEALLANIDMEALLRLAKAHSVSAMVCMALEQTDAFRCAEESIRLKWLDAKNKAVRKNMLLDAERHQLEKEFAEHGIWWALFVCRDIRPVSRLSFGSGKQRKGSRETRRWGREGEHWESQKKIED